MKMTNSAEMTVQPVTEYLCPTHLEKLRGLLRGGVGWCGKCGLYTLAKDMPMPQLTPEVRFKRLEREQSKQARRKTAKTNHRDCALSFRGNRKEGEQQ